MSDAQLAQSAAQIAELRRQLQEAQREAHDAVGERDAMRLQIGRLQATIASLTSAADDRKAEYDRTVANLSQQLAAAGAAAAGARADYQALSLKFEEQERLADQRQQSAVIDQLRIDRDAAVQRAERLEGDLSRALAQRDAFAAKFDALAGEPVAPGIRRRTAYAYLTDDGIEHPNQADALKHVARHVVEAAMSANGSIPRDKALDAVMAIRRAAEPKSGNGRQSI